MLAQQKSFLNLTSVLTSDQNKSFPFKNFARKSLFAARRLWILLPSLAPFMAGLQEEQSHANMSTESDDEVEKIALGVRTKFQVSLQNGAHISECVKNETKVTKHFRPVNNEHGPKNLSVKPYFGNSRKGGTLANKSISDGKMTLIVDDTRFVVDRTLFDSRPNTMLARYCRYLFTKKNLEWKDRVVVERVK